MRTGSSLCTGCGKLVGVNDEACFNCGQKKPGKRNWLQEVHKRTNAVGFERIVMAACLLLFACSLIWDVNGIGGSGLMSFLSPSGPSLLLFGASGSFPVFQQGHWWTVLSASLLHGSLLHIGFNLYWLNTFLPVTQHVYGFSRTVLGFTAASVVGFSLSSIMGLLLPGMPLIGGAVLTVGASAAIFGLLGLLVASGGSLGGMMMRYALIFVVFGLLFLGTDNWAHVGGFIGGYLAGKWFGRLPKNEKIENMLAVFCIFAFLASVIVSVIVNFSIAQNI